MIVGMGIDIAELTRLENSVKRFQNAFLNRIFTPAELAEGARRKSAAAYYAGRWAVKEAVAKALGTGIGKSCSWQDIETLNRPDGRPETRLSGAARQRFGELGADRLLTTISHEEHHAVAMAILEKLP